MDYVGYFLIWEKQVKYLNNFKLSILEVKICENDDKISIFGNREITFNYHSEEFSKYKTFVTKRLKWRDYFFLRGPSNESCNLIGSLRGQYFPISAHGQR